MPDFDIQGRLQAVRDRVEGLRPHLLPIPALNAARGPLMRRLGGGAPAAPYRAQAFPDPAGFPEGPPNAFRTDSSQGGVPTIGKGYRVTT